MLIYPYFKVLSTIPPNQTLVKEITNDNQLNNLCNKLYDIRNKYDSLIVSRSMTKREAYKMVYEELNDTINRYMEEYNKFNLCNFYIWNDCIMRVNINGRVGTLHGSKYGNCYGEPDPEEKSHIMDIVGNYINNLCKENNIDVSTVRDDIFLVFIDIIIKNVPTFMVFPGDLYDDYEDDY